MSKFVTFLDRMLENYMWVTSSDPPRPFNFPRYLKHARSLTITSFGVPLANPPPPPAPSHSIPLTLLPSPTQMHRVLAYSGLSRAPRSSNIARAFSATARQSNGIDVPPFPLGNWVTIADNSTFYTSTIVNSPFMYMKHFKLNETIFLSKALMKRTREKRSFLLFSQRSTVRFSIARLLFANSAVQYSP